MDSIIKFNYVQCQRTKQTRERCKNLDMMSRQIKSKVKIIKEKENIDIKI